MTSVLPNPSAADQRLEKTLEDTVSSGDLATVSILLAQWPTQPSLEPSDEPFGPKPAGIPYEQDLWPFTVVLHKAIKEDKAQIASYVLGLGLKPQPYATMLALDIGSIRIFQALFDNGWDIDAPLASNMCPPLWFV